MHFSRKDGHAVCAGTPAGAEPSAAASAAHASSAGAASSPSPLAGTSASGGPGDDLVHDPASGQLVHSGNGNGTNGGDGKNGVLGDERELSLSYARTLSWLSLLVVLLVSLGLSFFISNQARQTLMERQEGFALLLAQNLNNQIFQRFAVPTILTYGHISLRQEDQHDRLDGVVRSVIEGLPVSRLRVYDFSRVVAYSTDHAEVGRKGLAPLNIGEAFQGELPKPEILSSLKVWEVPFNWPLKPGSYQLRVIYPLRGDAYNSGGTPVLGVLELTQDITADYAQVLLFQAAIVIMCLLSSVLIFTLLLIIIHRAERVISWRMQKNLQLEKEIQSTERLVSMGRVVASIAHEIRNPLGIIRSTAELLQRRAKNSSDRGTARLLEAIYDESLRLSQTVNDFLDYARPRKPKQDAVDLELVIRQILAFVESDFARDGIEVRTSVSGHPWVLGDKDLLYRALYNLFVNGRQAMERDGVLDVAVEVADGRVRVAVTDTGPGFPPEFMDKFFEPFFTTKDSGTGLGLPIVRSIVESHGGEVRLSNSPEGGARVEVFLPAAPGMEEVEDERVEAVEKMEEAENPVPHAEEGAGAVSAPGSGTAEAGPSRGPEPAPLVLDMPAPQAGDGEQRGDARTGDGQGSSVSGSGATAAGSAEGARGAGKDAPGTRVSNMDTSGSDGRGPEGRDADRTVSSEPRRLRAQSLAHYAKESEE